MKLFNEKILTFLDFMDNFEIRLNYDNKSIPMNYCFNSK